MVILLSGVKKICEKTHFPVTCEEGSVSICVTKINVINYQLWEATAFIQIFDLLSMYLLVLFSLKKGDTFSGTTTEVFLWTPEASIQAKERQGRKLLHKQHCIWFFDIYLVKPSCISVAHCSC